MVIWIDRDEQVFGLKFWLLNGERIDFEWFDDKVKKS